LPRLGTIPSAITRPESITKPKAVRIQASPDACSSVQQDRREKQVALARLDRFAVDREWDRRAGARNEAPEQAGFGNIAHDGLFIHNMCS
jgi:hypothetical protein